jgi:hypothetical protein
MKQSSENKKDKLGFPQLESGFSVPEGYFDSFGERLRLRMKAEQLSSSRRRTIIYYLKPALGVAAVLAVMLTVYLYPPGNQRTSSLAGVTNAAIAPSEVQSELLASTYASLITDGQFISALSEMDEYDTSKMPKEDLADYLASNCSDFEILNSSK